MTETPPQNTFGSLATVDTLNYPPRPPRIRFSGKVLTADRGGLRVPVEARQHCALFSNGMWLVREESAELQIVKDVMALAERKGYRITDPRFVSPDVLVQALNYAKRANPLLPRWVFFVLAGLIALTLLGFAGRLIWFCDLFGYFRLHYAVAGLGLLVLMLKARKWIYAVMCLASIVVNLVTVVAAIPTDTFATVPMPPVGAPQLSVALASAPTGSGGQDQALRWIEARHPDLVVVLQANRMWQDVADRLKPSYPYAKLVDSSGEFGVLVLSRVPFKAPTVSTAGLSQMPVVATELETSLGRLGLIVAHAPPLTSNANAYDRNMYLSQLNAMMAAMPIPTLLVGNLNAPPWSVGFDGLKMLPNLVPSSLSLPATWPAFAGPLGVPLDYILLSTPAGEARQVDIHGVQTQEPFEGSSHMGVFATLVQNVP